MQKKVTSAEQKFREQLVKTRLKIVWIENVLNTGTPDALVTFPGGDVRWVELKALPETNVQLRGAQYAFYLEHGEHAPIIQVLNWDPVKDMVSVWQYPFEVDYERSSKGHVKIISAPFLHVPRKLFLTTIGT